jgi:Tol biopolymer transport system component
MQDVATDGRVLLSTVKSRLGIRYVDLERSSERDLAWLDASYLYDISADARTLLFVELSYGEGRNSAIYLRKSDGSAAVQLGYGNRPSLSPDGKWVVCIRREPKRSALMLLPTGPGESRFLNVDGMSYESLAWFPDNKRVVFTGNVPGRPVRTWIYNLDSEQVTPLTSEGNRGTLVSPDGHWLIASDPHKLYLAPTDGGPVRTLGELQGGEQVVRWSGDGRYIFLRRPEGETIRIGRFEVATGHREHWHTVNLPEPGAEFIGALALSADGKVCAFSFQHDLADLYLVKGLK